MNIDAPQFGAADVAAMLDETEGAIRRWHHSGFSNFFGRKSDYSVRYSARDVAGFAVARDLVRLNFPPPLAARIGATVTHSNPKPDAVLEGSPAAIAMIAPEAGSGIAQDRVAWRIPARNSATVSIPVGRIFADIAEKAGRVR